MKTRGFTLVEVLVVLVITSMVSALLFQVLAQVGRVQSRFGEQLAQSQEGAMRAEWFREVVHGLQVVEADNAQRFVGQRQRFVGLTRTGLQARAGAAHFVAVEVRETPKTPGGEVRVAQAPSGEQATTLLAWAGSGTAEFAYLDSNGVEYTQWPPAPGQYKALHLPQDLGGGFTAQPANPVPPQLPATVILRWPGSRGPEMMVASPRGSLEAVPKRLEAGGIPVSAN